MIIADRRRGSTMAIRPTRAEREARAVAIARSTVSRAVAAAAQAAAGRVRPASAARHSIAVPGRDRDPSER